MENIGDLLWFTSKVMEVEMLESGFLWTHRPTPSAGGRHPIDILVSLPSEFGSRSFCVYNPLDHSLNELEVDASDLNALIEHTDNILTIGNATILWFVAHSYRTSSKYENSESLVWRDAGALLYCHQLVSQALGIRCCPLGSLGEPYVSNLLGGDTLYGVGGCLLG
ncbi:nitroreductase family protein [Pontibacter fetidus]|uniref:nitroreductase family protein n=1 Tax=Pontibacter fetidus TaxID=2700082 RepID=UPI001F3768E9|nr:hypothetical protein [Pontibacter fetidus]